MKTAILSHGTVEMYHKGCRCNRCGLAKSEAYRLKKMAVLRATNNNTLSSATKN